MNGKKAKMLRKLANRLYKTKDRMDIKSEEEFYKGLKKTYKTMSFKHMPA